MKRSLLLPVLLLAGCAPAADIAVTRPPIETQGDARQAYPALQAVADAAVAKGEVPAISIAVGLDGEPATFISAGHLTTDPASAPAGPDTLWRIYSMTKPVTGIAAMILVDEGKLGLDQPVGDILPEFKESRVLLEPAKSLATRAASRPVTVRDLLTHTGGLNYAIFGSGPAFDALRARGVTPFALSRTSEEEMRPLRPASLREFARRAAEAGLVADPGTRFSYSMGLDVLAAVIEEASGMPFETFVQQRLFDPLEMRSTYWQVPRSEAGRLATNYAAPALAGMLTRGTAEREGAYVVLDHGAGSIYLDAPSFPYGGAGLVSTARDYDHFLQMLLDDGRYRGKRVLSAETARLARSNLMPAGVTLRNVGPIPPNEDAGFGAGGFVTTSQVDGFGRHRGTYGWDGAAGTRAWVDPGRRVRATMMINFIGAATLAGNFERALAADLAAAGRR